MIPPEPWLIELINETGTPHFIFDLHVIRKQIIALRKALPQVTLYYSTKTNSEPAIIDTCHQEGMHFDAASLGEIELLIGRGVQPTGIIYTHPVKTPQEIRKAYELGVRQFTCDSLRELAKLHLYAPAGHYFIRFNPNKNKSLYNYKQRLGASQAELKEILNYSIEQQVPIFGLSFHVGTQSMGVDPWIKALRQSREVMREYYQSIPSMRTLNMGSGFPVDYGFGKPPSLSQIGEQIQQEIANFASDIKFIAEPGRIIAGPAGTLLTSVIERIERGKTSWLFTDTTVYSGLIERLESSGQFTYPIMSRESSSSTQKYSIAGKTLDPDDIIAENIELSSAIGSGDLIIIGKCGAYTAEFFTSYHRLPRPLVTFYDSEHSDKVNILSSSVANKGVRARRNIATNETLFTVTGHRTNKRSRTSFQIGDETHLEPNLFGAYLNHSCAPNSGIQTNAAGLLNVIARQPIQAGDEVTVDYAMFEYELADMAKVPCQCQTADCRHSILGYKNLPDHKKQDYQHHTAHHLTKHSKAPTPKAN